MEEKKREEEEQLRRMEEEMRRQQEKERQKQIQRQQEKQVFLMIYFYYWIGENNIILACLFRSLAIVMARSLLCKNLKNFLKIFKVSLPNFSILAHHDKIQLQDKGHNSESYSFGVLPLKLKIFISLMASDRLAFVPHAVLLYFCQVVDIWFCLCQIIKQKNSNKVYLKF